jgi:type I restriction enzyme R subunit
MPDPHKEVVFEDELCAHLAAHGWLYSPDDSGYDRERALFPADLFGWLQDTQLSECAKLQTSSKAFAEDAFLDRLLKLMDERGALWVLRNPVKVVAAKFDLCQFKPSHGLNPELLERYAKVRLRVMRQVHYSVSNQNSIDLVFFVNGIPVATAELKTDFTQSVENAKNQYRFDRLPKDAATKLDEPLLKFKRGALVHFAVSTDEVYMTTHLKGKTTFFLPFNLGCAGGKGNPPNLEGGYRTAYLWERVLERDSWLNVLGRFVHLEKKDEVQPDGTTKRKESLIFPRYHQLDAVTKLVATARIEGTGHNYLIQHSAGSGKTNSISWLAHQLASLHDAGDQRAFHSVLVVTDRTVLDDQLRDAIQQLDHKTGVVKSVTNEEGSKSSKLAEALKGNTPIIVVTIQTFPFVLELIREDTSLKERRFAVIADEAHSSQTGNAAKKLKQVLTAERLAEIEEGGEIDLEEVLQAEMAGHRQPRNISFFAFTATPKAKTLELFGRPGEGGLPEPFHLYSMQQAIEEGFILDVLRNYTPYRLAWRLAHNGQDYDDETVDRSQAMKSLVKWVRLHPYNIAQKVEVIVEHFRENVGWRLEKKAKAMVVTGSRKEAVRYKLAMDKYISACGYRDVAALVAFSGEVSDPESGPDGFNETNMNKALRGRDLREGFATDEYNVMIVANKFQTGFDQPLLVAMYVDKRLAGVTAVQTLSRLNRISPGKDTTFVLDFLDQESEILEAFRLYYRKAELSGVTDPNLVHDLQDKLDAEGIYTAEEVDAFVAVVFGPKPKQADLLARLTPAVERFRVRLRDAVDGGDEKARNGLELFRRNVQAFVRAYDFLSQIVDYGAETALEKRAVFYRHLGPLLEIPDPRGEIDLSRVVLTHYHIKNLGNRLMPLADSAGEDPKLKPMTEVGSAQVHDADLVRLREIIQKLNELFEGELTDKDQINYVHGIRDKMLENPVLAQQAAANQKDQFGASPDFESAMMNAVVAAYENHMAMSEQVLKRDNVKAGLKEILKDLVYEAFAKGKAGDGAAAGE